MNNFQELKKKRPELAETLESMSREELLDRYALEVAEKDELEDFKNTYDDYQEDLECIVNSAKRYLVKRHMHENVLEITTKRIELIFRSVQTEWI